MAKPIPASEKTARKDPLEKKKGVARTPEEEEALVGEVIPYVQRGLSRSKACTYLGIDESVLSVLLKRRPDLTKKIERAELFVLAAAEANISDSIVKGQEKGATEKDKIYATENSKWYVERVDRNKYSKKTINEQEGAINLVEDNKFSNLSKKEKRQLLELMNKAEDKEDSE